MVRFEVLSSNAWIAMLLFLVFARLYPRIRAAAILVFPATFLTIALAMFLNPEIRKLPPSLRSIWLVLHVTFYKISTATLLIALALSILLVARKRSAAAWLSRLPAMDVLDAHAHRFAGFGFVFWAIGMLAGSIWAHESWGRFWGWDPIETWSLVTFALFGIYLHLRRFFGWKGERAAWAFAACFAIALVTVFFVPVLGASVHAEYFR
jgi:cytochrome c-type biogenesis protein CcsB